MGITKKVWLTTIPFVLLYILKDAQVTLEAFLLCLLVHASLAIAIGCALETSILKTEDTSLLVDVSLAPQASEVFTVHNDEHTIGIGQHIVSLVGLRVCLVCLAHSLTEA
jgi:hypothetical protein